MEPKNIHFGGGAAQSFVNPVVLLIVIAAGLVVCFRSRQHATAAFLLASLLIPIDQVLLVGSLHFPMLRVMVLFGLVRICRDKLLFRSKVFTGGTNKIDIALMLFAIVVAINGMLLFKESGEVVYQLGNVYTTLGAYCLLRHLMHDKDDVVSAARTVAFIAIFVAVIMLWETETGHNPYALLGGARSWWYATLMERDDRFRAMGGFGHPLLAGSFGAGVIPLCALLWWSKRSSRLLAAIAAVAATVIVITSNSSTSILAYAGGILALGLWPMRRWMRQLRWAIVLTLVSLHMVMKAPVWHLISRIDLAGGSSSWHRFALIDQCIRHFGDWWLIGVKSTAAWGWDMWDTANWYVGICDASGLVPFLLFVAIIVHAFKYLGKARKGVTDKKSQLFFWALGCSVLANVVAFFGISYWDQTQVAWYALLAAISAVAVRAKSLVHAPTDVAVQSQTWDMELVGEASL